MHVISISVTGGKRIESICTSLLEQSCSAWYAKPSAMNHASHWEAPHAWTKLGTTTLSMLSNQHFVLTAQFMADAEDLLRINDISVDESEDLPKILGPLAEEGPLAALGRAHQQSDAALSPATSKRRLLQTMKLAAPAIVKLQVHARTVIMCTSSYT